MKVWNLVFGIVFVIALFSAIANTQAALPNIICYSLYAGEFCFNETNVLWSKNTTAAIYTQGKVGVGSADPESQLQVSGGGLCVGSDANCNADNNAEGIIYSSSTSMTAYDLAENFPTKNKLSAGDLTCFSKESPIFIQKCSNEFDTMVAGIISTQPGALLGGFNGKQFDNEVNVPLALAGRVPAKVTNANGNIEIGDLLTSSKIPGYSMKYTTISYSSATTFSDLKVILEINELRRNSIVGKALEPCDKGFCEILVLVG